MCYVNNGQSLYSLYMAIHLEQTDQHIIGVTSFSTYQLRPSIWILYEECVAAVCMLTTRHILLYTVCM